MVVKEKIGRIKNLGLATIAAGTSWKGFAELNNYLFPAREKAYELLGIKSRTLVDFLYNLKDVTLNNAPALAYFELSRAAFQGSVGIVGNEFVKLLYGTRLEKLTKKFFGEKNSFQQRFLSTALGGAIVEAARTGLAYKNIIIDKMDPNYVFNYLVEPRQAIPEEIGRSILYGMAFLYVASRLRKSSNKKQ